MTIIVAVIVLVAAGAVFVAVRNRSQKEQPSRGTSQPSARGRAEDPKPAGDDPQVQLKEILDSLLRLNLLIRTDPELQAEIREELEAVIDDLAAVIPSMMDRYPGETLTYEIKKIGREHLFRTVKEYLDLSPESRANQMDIFKTTIQSLHDVSRRSRDIVEKNETAEFKTMANFLAGKFS